MLQSCQAVPDRSCLELIIPKHYSIFGVTGPGGPDDKDVAEPFGRKAEPGGAKELGIFDNYTPESSHGT